MDWYVTGLTQLHLFRNTRLKACDLQLMPRFGLSCPILSFQSFLERLRFLRPFFMRISCGSGISFRRSPKKRFGICVWGPTVLLLTRAFLNGDVMHMSEQEIWFLHWMLRVHSLQNIHVRSEFKFLVINFLVPTASLNFWCLWCLFWFINSTTH